MPVSTFTGETEDTDLLDGIEPCVVVIQLITQVGYDVIVSFRAWRSLWAVAVVNVFIGGWCRLANLILRLKRIPEAIIRVVLGIEGIDFLGPFAVQVICQPVVIIWIGIAGGAPELLRTRRLLSHDNIIYLGVLFNSMLLPDLNRSVRAAGKDKFCFN